MANILVYIELVEDRALRASLEALLRARRLATRLGSTLYAALPCATPPLYGEDDIIAVLSRYGADKVILMTHQSLTFPSGFGGHGEAVLSACHQFPPAMLILADTAAGRDIAPRVAAQLGAVYLTHPQMEVGDDLSLKASESAADGRRKRLLELDHLQRPVVMMLNPRTLSGPRELHDEAEVVVISPGTSARLVVPAGSFSTGEAVPFARGVPLVVAGEELGRDELEAVDGLAAALGADWAVTWDAWDKVGGPIRDVVGAGASCVGAPLVLTVGVSGDPLTWAAIPPRTRVASICRDPNAPVFQRAECGLAGEYGSLLESLLELASKSGAGEKNSEQKVSKPGGRPEQAPVSEDPVSKDSSPNDSGEPDGPRPLAKEELALVVLLSPARESPAGCVDDRNPLTRTETAALRTAVQLGASVKAPVTAVTCGPEDAEVSLRYALDNGAERAVRIWADFLDGADYRATSRVLAAVVKELKATVALSGDRSDRWGRGLTGPATASHAGFSHVTGALEAAWLEQGGGYMCRVQRAYLGRVFDWRVALPSLITVVSAPKGNGAAKKKADGDIELWDLEKVGLSEVDLRPLCRVEGSEKSLDTPPAKMLDDAKALYTWIAEALSADDKG